MTTGVRRRVDDRAFDIHEDVRTEETEVMEDMDDDGMGDQEGDHEDDHDNKNGQVLENTQANRLIPGANGTIDDPELMEDYDEYDEVEEEDEEEDVEEPDYDASDNERVDGQTQSDMKKLEGDFPGFRRRYRLIKRIGEGKLSCGQALCVYH